MIREPINTEFRANPNLINRDLAMRSHSGTSFDPEKRGEQEISGFASYVQGVYERLKKAAKTDRQKEYLLTEMNRFESTFAGKYNDKLSAQGSCMSTMIAGPSGFPTGRAQKACSAADKRYEELIEFRDRAEAAILRELKKIGVEEAGGEIEVMKAKLAAAERNHEFMVKTNIIVRKKISDEQKIKEIMALGTISEKTAREVLKPDFMGRVGFPAYALSNDTANIKRMKERIAELEKKEATPSGDIIFEGGKIVDNREQDRIQIFFDTIPSEELRKKLKSEGWHWSPHFSAWMRKRTDMALSSARRILGLEAQKPVFVPVKEEPKIDEEVQARIQKIIDIMKIYRDRGATYEDLLAGLKGYYLVQSGYVMGSNLDAQKLIDDLKKSGYTNLRDLWRKIIVQAPERIPTIFQPERVPMLYPAPAPTLSPAAPQRQAEAVARIRQENETILAKEREERERIKAIERAEESELNAELNKLSPALKRHAETQIYGTLHMPDTHKDYRNRYSIALGKVRRIAFEFPEEKEEQPQPEFRMEPWEMTQEEYWRAGAGGKAFEGRGTSDYNHKQAVYKAILEGKPVSAEVLKDYPDLMKKEVPSPKIQTVQDIKQQVIQSIHDAKSMDELKQILKGLGFLPLPEPEKRQLIDLYQNRFSEMMGELKFGERITEEETRKKRRAPPKVTYAPGTARRLEEFGIKEAMRQGYGYA